MATYEEVKQDIAMRRREGFSYPDIELMYRWEINRVFIRRIHLGLTLQNKVSESLCSTVNLDYNVEHTKSIKKIANARFNFNSKFNKD